MPKISLWNHKRGADYNFTDRAIGENVQIGGTGILIHMYEGPTTDSEGNTDTTLTTIQDILFLTNANRKYNPNVIELKGHYTPQDVNFDLSQFGIFLSSDTIRIQFHYNNMIDSLGRKLISGDVLEFPNMVDTPVFDNATGINRYYVVQDALYAAAGYGNTWYPHLWLVRAKLISGSNEYKDIMDSAASGQTSGGAGQGVGIFYPGFAEDSDSNGNPGTGANNNIKNTLDLFCQISNISDKIVKEAEDNVFFDPKFFQSANLYIYIDKNGYPVLGSNYFSGDGAPANYSTDIDQDLKPSGPLAGVGVSFPDDMNDGEYYLRIDYNPERLFQKQGNCYKLIEVNVLKHWTAYNRVLDTFVDSINDTLLPDGTVVSEKQPLSQVLKQKVDLYAERKTQVTDKETLRSDIANNRAAKRGY